MTLFMTVESWTLSFFGFFLEQSSLYGIVFPASKSGSIYVHTYCSRMRFLHPSWVHPSARPSVWRYSLRRPRHVSSLEPILGHWSIPVGLCEPRTNHPNHSWLPVMWWEFSWLYIETRGPLTGSPVLVKAERKLQNIFIGTEIPHNGCQGIFPLLWKFLL